MDDQPDPSRSVPEEDAPTRLDPLASAGATSAAVSMTVPFTEGPGAVIGHYKLLQKIGEGGFGVVYMAEQTEPVRRRVALKVIKLGMDTKAGHRPLRGRAAGAGADGPSEHRQGARRRCHRHRPALLRDGTGQGHPHHRLLRPEQPLHHERLGPVHAGLPRHPARAPERHHPPGHQAVQHPRHAARRRAGAQGDRLRHRQGHDRPAISRTRPCSSRPSSS
jgi:hypothetical protein